ncbi:hypothetical protein I5H63_gp077 [Mycobacterium phage MilleniumForce]|uniref:Uncharacterized protein n=1 Tax=Mycobacterium phage MilleniumForce TaxID=2315711 RepID=A0A386KNG5_9CAUD|nr:hypothetical protein I5H63_gp077 [Mycobacterium phage MilleniumForce]AYD86902.1 hypothetical protein SEA_MILLENIUMFORCE_77 [Mycobacterium phage MilleniumForce]
MGKHHAKPDIRGILKQFEKQHDNLLDQLSAIERYDPITVYAVLSKLACPLPCVGYVNDTGWHLDCQRRAREAMVLLGFSLPPESLWERPLGDEDR